MIEQANLSLDRYTDEELRKGWREVKADVERRGECVPTRTLILLGLFEKEIIRRFVAQDES